MNRLAFLLSLRHLLLITLFLGLVPSSCNTGSCDDPRVYKVDLNELSFYFHGSGLNTGTPATVIPQGEFHIQVSLEGNYLVVGNTSPEVPLFTQSLIARDPCQPNQCSGFRVEIDSFNITCDTVFLSKPAGAALNQHFNVIYVDRYSPNWPQDTLVTLSGFNDSWRKNPLFLVSSNGPETFNLKAIEFIKPGNYHFTVTMLLKDGTLISRETDLIHFE